MRKKAEKERIRRQHKNAPLSLIRSFTVRPVKSTYERFIRDNAGNVKSFILVRHPFNRLVSAFRDKIERSHEKVIAKDWYYKVYGKPIVSRYRRAALARFGADFFSAENNFGAVVPVKGGVRTADLPTFWEFVQYVKACRISRMDEHWKPVYEFCSPCHVNYESVIHFENLSDEAEHLKSVLEPGRPLASRWENPNYSGMTQDDLTIKYFQTLSKSDIEELYKIYELDMKMFGYRFHMGNITLPRF